MEDHPSRVNPLALLPPELLIAIHHQSANPLFPYTSRQILSALSARSTRLTFAVTLFDPTYDFGIVDLPSLDIAQTQLLGFSWFDCAFAAEVAWELKARTKCLPRVSVGAKLPRRRTLCPRWDAEKARLLEILTDWGVRAHWGRERRNFPGFWKAVEGGWEKVVGIYMGDMLKMTFDEADVLFAIEIDAIEGILLLLIDKLYQRPPYPELGTTRVFKAVEERTVVAARKARERIEDGKASKTRLGGEGEQAQAAGDRTAVSATDEAHGDPSEHNKWQKLLGKLIDLSTVLDSDSASESSDGGVDEEEDGEEQNLDAEDEEEQDRL